MANYVNKNWIRFRELLINWLADWPKSYDIKNLLNYKGYSLWWSSNLIKKDVVVDIRWVAKLYERIENKSLYLSSSNSKKRTPMYILYIFVLDLYRFLVIKLFIPKKNPNSDVYFYSIQLNIIKKKDLLFDRHYGGALSKKSSANLSSSYLLALSNDYLGVLNPFKYRKKINKIIESIDSEVTILDQYRTLKDIFSVHFSILKMYLVFLREKRKKSFKDSFVIDGVQCDDLLVKEIEKGFYGGYQSSLFSGLQLLNYCNDQDNDLIIVSYLETLSAARPLYYFARKSKTSCTFIGLQHSTIYKNKIDFYNRKQEFNYNSIDAIRFSPQPDFYLLHGAQAKEMVSEFMNENQLEIIGCIKYDSYINLISELKSLRKDLKSLINSDGKFTILLAPSFGVDFVNMLAMLKNVDYDDKKIRFIISPHPLVSFDSIKKMINKLSIKDDFEFFPDLSTQELVIACDLVVCGFSSIAIEALIFETQSIRIIRENQIPLFENEEAIKYISNKDEFWEYINSNLILKERKKLSEESKKLINYYLYKIDGYSQKRMWAFLNNLKLENSRGIEANERI